jgi:predicted Na+-dependent transporter
MAHQTKPAASGFLYYSKYLGLALTIIGIPTMILDTSFGSELPLLVGLFILLVTAEKIEDERSVQIKTTSLYLAFVIAYAVKLITSNLYDHSVIPFELVEINHFLILTLMLANGIFYGRLYVLKQ